MRTASPWHAGQGNGEGCIFMTGEGRMRLEPGGTALYPIATVHDFEGERDDNIAFIVKACNCHEELVNALRDCVTKPGALAYANHVYALRRLKAINEIVQTAIAKAAQEPS